MPTTGILVKPESCGGTWFAECVAMSRRNWLCTLSFNGMSARTGSLTVVLAAAYFGCGGWAASVESWAPLDSLDAGGADNRADERRTDRQNRIRVRLSLGVSERALRISIERAKLRHGWTEPVLAEENLCMYVANRQPGAWACRLAPPADYCVCPDGDAWQDFITDAQLSLVPL